MFLTSKAIKKELRQISWKNCFFIFVKVPKAEKTLIPEKSW